MSRNRAIVLVVVAGAALVVTCCAILGVLAITGGIGIEDEPSGFTEAEQRYPDALDFLKDTEAGLRLADSQQRAELVAALETLQSVAQNVRALRPPSSMADIHERIVIAADRMERGAETERSKPRGQIRKSPIQTPAFARDDPAGTVRTGRTADNLSREREVPRRRIELRTPRFSVACSTN